MVGSITRISAKINLAIIFMYVVVNLELNLYLKALEQWIYDWWFHMKAIISSSLTDLLILSIDSFIRSFYIVRHYLSYLIC